MALVNFARGYFPFHRFLSQSAAAMRSFEATAAQISDL